MAKKKKRSATMDLVKATRKADRELEYELKGAGWHAKDKAVKSQKAYDRKRNKRAVIKLIAERGL